MARWTWNISAGLFPFTTCINTMINAVIKLNFSCHTKPSKCSHFQLKLRKHKVNYYLIVKNLFCNFFVSLIFAALLTRSGCNPIWPLFFSTGVHVRKPSDACQSINFYYIYTLAPGHSVHKSDEYIVYIAQTGIKLTLLPVCFYDTPAEKLYFFIAALRFCASEIHSSFTAEH